MVLRQDRPASQLGLIRPLGRQGSSKISITTRESGCRAEHLLLLLGSEVCIKLCVYQSHSIFVYYALFINCLRVAVGQNRLEDGGAPNGLRANGFGPLLFMYAPSFFSAALALLRSCGCDLLPPPALPAPVWR